MLSKKIQDALNKQIEVEAFSSQLYLAMASWAETKGFSGAAKFFYAHSDEERTHMLKLIQFVNERGGNGIVPALKQPPKSFSSLSDVFQGILDHEVEVSSDINKLVDTCLKEKDYTTNNFLQWYVSEQIEEERLARTICDRLALAGGDKGSLFLFDKELEGIAGETKE